jgi:antitoxin component YwqK of YwqJK toxin-antitoxin module
MAALIAVAAAGCSSTKVERANTMHPNGTLASRFSYYMDENERPVYHGKYDKFYENGVLESSRTYVKGSVEGRAMFYTRNQETMYITFKNNEANGPMEIFYPTGKRRLQGECFKGRLHGRFVYWSEDGKKLAEGTYQNGAPYTGTFVMGSTVKTYQKGRLIKSDPLSGPPLKSTTDDRMPTGAGVIGVE